MDKRTKINRVGETNFNKYDSKMTIVEYISYSNIIVEFENKFKTKASYKQFLKGYISNPYDKSLYGIGYLGEGKYKTKINNKFTPQYNRWVNMMTRCYNKKTHMVQPTYAECLVDPIWHNFQKFAEWYDKNYYEVDNETMCLDKDILIKGNKIYSPENCIFVPERINSLFLKCDKRRGNLPIGITLHKRKIKKDNYMVQMQNNNGKPIFIGVFDTTEEAFIAYKNSKEQVIKQMAENYKDKIPKKLYNALYYYEVEIID